MWGIYFSKHSLSWVRCFRKIATEAETTGNLRLFHREHLLTAFRYIRLLQCLFKQLPKYIKTSSAHEAQYLKQKK